MATLKIYNDINTEEEKSELECWGYIGGVCFKDIDEFCSNIPEDDNEIDVRLHCRGGSVTEGWAIYDRLRATGKEITCTVDGFAASMATIILMAAPKERRKAYSNSTIHVHNPWIEPWNLDYSLNADDLQKSADDLKAEQDRMLNVYVERCECDREAMQALMDADKDITAKEAMEYGLISEVIPPASAKQINNFGKSTKNKMGKENEVKVKASLMKRALAKLGLSSLDELKGMDLTTADGQTLTIEREEGEPQVGDKATPDGEFVMPDGKTIVVQDGVITDIKTDSNSASTEEPTDAEQRIEQLEQEVEELKEQLEELKKEKEEAEKNAKSVDDLRILNAVKMAGGEKALAKISSNYKPAGRTVPSHNASQKANSYEEAIALEKEAIKARLKRK